MARPQETFNKKEQEKLRAKKKKEKGNAAEANMLFNLEKDPGETTNVFDKNPEIVEKTNKTNIK